MNGIIDRIKNEPVLVYTLVGNLLALAVVFGVQLSDVQTAAILAVVNSTLAFVARRKVTPVPSESPEDAV